MTNKISSNLARSPQGRDTQIGHIPGSILKGDHCHSDSGNALSSYLILDTKDTLKWDAQKSLCSLGKILCCQVWMFQSYYCSLLNLRDLKVWNDRRNTIFLSILLMRFVMMSHATELNLFCTASAATRKFPHDIFKV